MLHGTIDQIWIWHIIMGNLHFDNLVKINKRQVVRDMPPIIKTSYPICKHFQHGNKNKVSFKTKGNSTSNPLHLIHTDLCGPTKTKSLQGEHYFILFIDDYTRMTWIGFLNKKLKAFENI